MKADTHPKQYRPVVFKDSASDFSFLSRSCASTKETVTWSDGNQYPLVLLGISSASHPYFTGQKMFVDTAGRVEKFSRRFGAVTAKSTAASVKASTAKTVAKGISPKKK
jgi:large subunit ribosomal protein L31